MKVLHLKIKRQFSPSRYGLEVPLICRRHICDDCYLRFVCLTNDYEVHRYDKTEFVTEVELIHISTDKAIEHFEYHKVMGALVWKNSRARQRKGRLKEVLYGGKAGN